MLEIRSLTKRYNGFTAVDNVSFQISPGEILGYLGPNGAGKSTTVKMLIGLLEPSDCEIKFAGHSILNDMPDFQRRIGYVPEEPHLYPHLSGREYLQLAGRLRGVPRRVLEEKMNEFLRLFSLWDDQHCPIQSYSKGMRQKILISAALLHNPGVLILDEPLSDPAEAGVRRPGRGGAFLRDGGGGHAEPDAKPCDSVSIRRTLAEERRLHHEFHGSCGQFRSGLFLRDFCCDCDSGSTAEPVAAALVCASLSLPARPAVRDAVPDGAIQLLRFRLE
jgi:energy-coupling factor transporter ATP-binding protein EcfA2